MINPRGLVPIRRDGLESPKTCYRRLMPYSIQDLDLDAVSVIHAMNENALPHVNSVAFDYFRAQLENGSYFRAVYSHHAPVAFLLAMDETADYDSLNFLWFQRRYPRFVYIDRVVVGPEHRRSGLGARLYADLEQWARGCAPRLACEVNVSPPNTPSLRFHENLGFVPVGSQQTDGGRKTVSLLVRELDDDRTEHGGR